MNAKDILSIVFTGMNTHMGVHFVIDLYDPLSMDSMLHLLIDLDNERNATNQIDMSTVNV